MKLSGLSLFAAVAAGSLFAAAPVGAQRHVEVNRTVTTTTTSNRPMHVNRWHNRRHKVCRTRWVNHRRVTRCYWR